MSDTKIYMGIEPGAVSLKIALVDGIEKRVLRTAVVPTEASPIDDVYSFEVALHGWMSSIELENVDSISVTIPAFHSVIRQVYIPAEAATHIDEYLQWYLESITCAEKNAYVVDYKILSGQPKVGFTVLLLAVRRQWVDGLRKGFRNKALAPKSMEVDVLSLMNLMDFSEKVDSLQCILKADYTGVVLMWMGKDNLQGLRCVSTLPLIDKDEDVAFNMLATEIVRQMELAKAEDAALDAKLIRLCGELALSEKFVEILRAVAKDCQVSLMDSFTNLRLPVEVGDAENVPVCSGAIGAALSLMEGV